jgi:hypothetical protein
LVKEIQIDKISWFRPRENAGQFACAQVGERLNDNALDRCRWSGDIGNGLMDDVGLNRVSVLVRKLRTYEMSHIAQQSDANPGLPGSPREKSHERPHFFGIVDEKVNVSGCPVSEVRSRESRSATQMTGDPDLTGTDEIQDEIRDDAAVEGVTHGLPGSC